MAHCHGMQNIKLSTRLLQSINGKKLEAALKAQKIISKIFFNQS